MAIAIVEKATLVVSRADQASVLRLLQAFQKIEIIDSSDAGEAVVDVPGYVSDKWRDALVKIEKAQNILSRFIHASTLQKLKNGRPVMTLTELETTATSSGWEDICSDILSFDDRLEFLRARRIELIRLMDQWAPWEGLPFCPKCSAEKLKFVSVSVGILKAATLTSFIESYAIATSGIGHYEEVFQRGGSFGIVLFYPQKMEQSVRDLCKQYEFSPCDFPFQSIPADMLINWRSEESEIIDEEGELLAKFEELSSKKDTLDLAEEFFRNLLLRNDARKMALESKSTFLLNGWVDKENVEELKDLLERKMKYPYYVSFSEVEKHEIPEVPVILKNKRIAGAFETLTEMYSMPAYDEIDPTPIMTPFYLVFFGMMVADIGYGVALLLATSAAKILFKPDKPLRKSIDFFFYLSFPVIAWGFIYGSLFGTSLPFTLLSPTEDIIPILIVSLVFGWMQLMTGLGMNVYVRIKRKDILGAFSGGISWMLLLLGLAALVISKTLLASNALFAVGLMISLLAVLGIVLLPIAENKGHRLKGLMKGLYALYGATGYVGDLVSYTRLMALGVAGSSIAVAFNTIISSLPLPARLTFGVLLAVVLHGLNLFLSMLGAYVHGIRLQYVEFFGKFYAGGGRKFNPFKTAEKHIYLAENDNAQIKKTEESL